MLKEILTSAACVFSFSEDNRQNYIYHTIDVNELIKIMPDGLSVDFGSGSSVIIDNQSFTIKQFVCYSDSQGNTIDFDPAIYHGRKGPFNISIEFIVTKDE